ncbi:MAG: helix-turn-helix transcriptional regulator [Bacilli bacterium]|nr:helix-turn-helix transcriptional regulator [Bacilli bacterium]
MKELREIIGENLTELRKANKLTQLDLAEKFNYGDKTISKWESGTNLPSIEVLLDLAKLYGVTLDYLVTDNKSKPNAKEVTEQNTAHRHKRHVFISLLAMVLVWIVATSLFVIMKSFCDFPTKLIWPIFAWAVPVTFIVGIVFNGIWGKRKWLIIFDSALLWSFLGALYAQLGNINPYFYQRLWYLFLIGIPLQIAFIFWQKLK